MTPDQAPTLDFGSLRVETVPEVESEDGSVTTDYPLGMDTPDKREWWDLKGKRIFSGKDRPDRQPKIKKPPPAKPRTGSLVKPFTDFYTSIGAFIVPFDQPCGMAVVNNAEPCARALENLARENPAVRRALLALVETSVWGQVIAAHLPIMLAIATHHVPAVRNEMNSAINSRGMHSVPNPDQNGVPVSDK
jgi:hypothetical protein